MSRTTITKAVNELNNNDKINGKTRRSGGGRKFVEPNYPGIRELKKDSILVGHVTTGKILYAMGYSKHLNQKMIQIGEPHIRTETRNLNI
jgi:hypothetical protein